MQFNHFEERFKVEFYSNNWKIWDNEKEKFVGADFIYEENAKLFLEKLKYFLYDYENNK
jgi:hypothetical protein